MKIWGVLTNKNGAKGGNVDKSTQYALMAVVLPVMFITNNIFAVMLSAVAVFVVAFFVRRKFNGRSDWLFIWYRLLFAPKGSWNLNERDGKKNNLR